MKEVPDATLTRITELLRTLNSGAFTVKPGAFTDLVAEIDGIQEANQQDNSITISLLRECLQDATKPKVTFESKKRLREFLQRVGLPHDSETIHKLI